ncbi:hypothetical protein ACLB2K_002082 [Fragaria x ananassa]
MRSQNTYQAILFYYLNISGVSHSLSAGSLLGFLNGGRVDHSQAGASFSSSGSSENDSHGDALGLLLVLGVFGLPLLVCVALSLGGLTMSSPASSSDHAHNLVLSMLRGSDLINEGVATGAGMSSSDPLA